MASGEGGQLHSAISGNRSFSLTLIYTESISWAFSSEIGLQSLLVTLKTRVTIVTPIVTMLLRAFCHPCWLSPHSPRPSKEGQGPHLHGVQGFTKSSVKAVTVVSLREMEDEAFLPGATPCFPLFHSQLPTVTLGKFSYLYTEGWGGGR